MGQFNFQRPSTDVPVDDKPTAFKRPVSDIPANSQKKSPVGYVPSQQDIATKNSFDALENGFDKLSNGSNPSPTSKLPPGVSTSGIAYRPNIGFSAPLVAPSQPGQPNQADLASANQAFTQSHTQQENTAVNTAQNQDPNAGSFAQPVSPTLSQKAAYQMKSIVGSLNKGIANMVIAPLYQYGNKVGLVDDAEKARILGLVANSDKETFGIAPDALQGSPDSPIHNTIDQFAFMAPALITAPETGGGSFGLQSAGSMATQVQQMKDKGVQFNNHSDDLMILGSGIIGTALGRGSLGKVFNSFGSDVKQNVVSALTADAIKDLADKGGQATAEDITNTFLSKAQTLADKVGQTGLSALSQYAKVGTELSAANAATFGTKKLANALSGNEPFKDTTGQDFAQQISEPFGLDKNAHGNPLTALGNMATSPAGMFGAIGGAGSALGMIGENPNPTIERLQQDNSPETVQAIKQELVQHGQAQGWTDDELQKAQAGVDMLSNTVAKLPKGLAKDKVQKGVSIIMGRNDLQDQLTQMQADRAKLDPSIADVPNPQEELIQNKIDQANDKIKGLVTGNRATYSKGTEANGEDGQFFKTINGVKEEITPSRYELETMERAAKAKTTTDDIADKVGLTPEGATPESLLNKGENTDASKIESTGTLDVGNTPGNGEEVGEGNTGQVEPTQQSEQQPNGSSEDAQQQEENLTPTEYNPKSGDKVSYKDKEWSIDKIIDMDKEKKVELVDDNGKSLWVNEPMFKGENPSVIPIREPTPEEGAFDSMSKQVNAPNTSETPNQISQEPPLEVKPQPIEVPEPKTDEPVETKTAEPNTEPTVEDGGSEVKKTILTKRAYEGEIQPEVKKYLEDKGLTRKSFSQEERSKQATDFINKFGEDAAHHAVENGDVDGGMAASILAQLQIRNSRAMTEFPEGSEERDALAKKQAENIALMEKKGYLGGEFNGQLAYEYQNAELDFANVKKQVEDLTGKPITEAQEKKVKDLTDQNQQLKQQLADSEAKLVEASDREFKQDVVKKETNAEKSKRIANKLRSLKITTVNDATLGIPVALYNGAIETSASLIEGGGKIADAIDKGLEHIRESDWYKSLSATKQQQTERDFKNKINDASGSNDLVDLQERFVNKSDSKFSPEDARAIWGYLRKTYIDNGTSYKDAISKTSDDLGLSWKQVSDAVTTPKIKRASDEMWKKQADLARNTAGIKNWIGDQNKSAFGKALQKISGVFRGVSVFGHGGIFVGTHAGMTMFNPSTWNKTISAFFRGWKFAYGNEANYERSMQELQNSPNYLVAQRAGLKNNPERINAEEYQKSQKFLGKLGLAGERGFNAIKVLRQDLFDYHFNKLTPAERDDPNVAKSVAQLVNLATGATNLKLPAWVNEASFAGGMEASRWQKLTSSPIEATKTAINALVNPSKATPADRVFAKVWARRVGEQLATYSTLLLANSAIQKTINPTNPVNMTHPDKPDFLKFKLGSTTIDPTSGMRSTAMFMHTLGQIPFESKKELHGDKRISVAGEKLAGYARGKLAPLYGTAADVFSGQDFNGNVMPYSNDKPAKYAHKLTWPEYAWSKAPLPIAEAAGVFYKSAIEHGAHKKTLDDVIKGIMSGGISGTTGFRVGEYDANKEKK